MTEAKAKAPVRKTKADAEDKSGSGIRAMMVGLTVLQALGAARRPLPLRDVANASNLTPSRVHRYLTSLVQSGFVRQDDRTGKYELGKAVVELGLLALGQLEPIQIGMRALRTFSEDSGLDSHLSVWGSAGPTVIRWLSGSRGDQIKIEEGRVLPILWSATGRVLIAHRPLKDVLALTLAEAALWNEAHPHAVITEADIAAICESVRATGMASTMPDSGSDKDELLGATFTRPHRLQIETAAVPIFDHLGRVPMVMTVFGSDTISLHGSTDYVRRLRDAAAHASLELGYR